MKLLVLTLALIFGFVVSECPNSCSGHGDCDSFDQCTCQLEGVVINPDGNLFPEQIKKGTSASKLVAWTGADCSLMTCPRGISWVQSEDENVDANADDVAAGNCWHKLSVECSDKGLCDRKSGQCNCFAGYTGAACQRTECPSDCSGHGICQSNVKFAQDATIMMDPSLFEEYGFNADFDYLISYDQAWDSGLHFGCKCDIGYRGPDCSMVECPSDDDPLDDFCNDQKDGLGYVEFVGSEYYYSAGVGDLDPQEAPLPNKLLLFVEDYEFENADKGHAWQYEDNLVTYFTTSTSNVRDNLNQCRITLDGEYQLSSGAALSTAKDSSSNQGGGARHRSGVQKAGNGGTNSAQAAQSAILSDCVNGVFCGGKSLGEPCSGRGLCNYGDGTCECHSGYAGNACQDVEELA